MRLALEPLNRFETDLINVVEQGLALVEAVGSPHLGLHLDTFHMHLEERDSATAIRAAGDRLFHFHACENDRGTPGRGQVAWAAVAAALADVGYGGPVVIESFTPEVKSIARAVCIWRELAGSQDELAREGVGVFEEVYLAGDERRVTSEESDLPLVTRRSSLLAVMAESFLTEATTPAVAEPVVAAPPAADVAPVLAVQGITKRFPGVQALDDVSLDFLPGEVHAVVGENGAGKSTLMKIMVGAYLPDGGEILLDGRAGQLRAPLGSAGARA